MDARQGRAGPCIPPASATFIFIAMASPSAQFSLILRVEIERLPGMLGRVASVIGEAGGQVGAVDIVEQRDSSTVREITVDANDEAHAEAIGSAVDAIDGARVLERTDRTFELHRGGKIFTGLKSPIRTRDDLSMA